jgi:MYXO-CTERM domain-containing protein
VTVNPPNPNCAPCGPKGGSNAASSASASGGGFDAGVTVISQMVVGPYETVQLSSSNPSALTDWLTMHGYNIPADVGPIVSAYVNEGFDFLALKLVPGAMVSAMQPVRVTTPGASPVLPLRMVAAGVGATVPITLFVVGEGRYQPANFPWFTIDPSQLVWDFATESSNYKTLRQAGFAATANKGWLVESAIPVSEQSVTVPLGNLAMNDPLQSGYADSMGQGAPMAEQADMTTLFTGIAPASLWISRLLAELPRTELSVDLTLGAATSQAQVPTTLTAPKYINTPPCPCGQGASGTGGTGVGGGGAGVGGVGVTSGTSGTSGTGGAHGTGTGGAGQSSSCAVGSTDERPALLSGLMVALAALVWRRRRAPLR